MSTSFTIGEIAMNHGFANSKAFARTFTARYGVLPSAYRKQRNETFLGDGYDGMRGENDG
jgi:AraC-like DNA-binding protein